MYRPFLRFDENYGLPFSPRDKGDIQGGLFVDNEEGLMPLPQNPLRTPFNIPDEQEQMLGSPFTDPALSSLVLMALLKNLDKKRQSEGTIKKEGKYKKDDKGMREDKEK